MSDGGVYRGIQYSVRKLNFGGWEWHITPPDAVLGLKPKRGFIVGLRNDAISRAKRAIEAQDWSVN